MAKTTLGAGNADTGTINCIEAQWKAGRTRRHGPLGRIVTREGYSEASIRLATTSFWILSR
jgi:hypothetical protein